MLLHHRSHSRFLNVLLHYRRNPSLFHTEPQLISTKEICKYTIDFFGRLLQQSSTLPQSKQLHAQITVNGVSSSPFLASTLVSIYSSYCLLPNAIKVFELSFSNASSSLVSNSMLRAFMAHGRHNEALVVYLKMLESQTTPDSFTFPLAVIASSKTGSSRICSIVHSHAIKIGYRLHLHVCNELLAMFSKQGVMIHALKVFDRMPVKTHVSWNTMLSGFALNRDCDAAIDMFRRMDGEGLKPNQVTWTSLITNHSRCNRHRQVVELLGVMLREGHTPPTPDSIAVVLSSCSLLHFIETGKTVQGYVAKAGLEQRTCVKNSLISMYGRHRLIKEAEKSFFEMREDAKDIVTWNSLISCYAEAGLCEKAVGILSELEKVSSLTENNSLKPNVVSWSSVMDGFVCGERWEESLVLFRKMNLSGVQPSCVTILIVLQACVELGAGQSIGREVHGYTVRNHMCEDCLVVNGLVNMYAKSGRVREAYTVFRKSQVRDIVSWNSMITGFGMHGYGASSLKMFDELREAGMVPDEVTFVAVLSACSHSGMVKEGGEIFEKMVEGRYGVEPRMEHYGCMVDLFGRAGLLKEAEKMLKRMPIEPNVCAWGSFLNSCRKHGDEEAAEGAAEKIFKSGWREVGGSYMLMCNIYAAGGRWEEAAGVRRSAKAKGVKKVAGESWIEVDKKVHRFSSSLKCCEGRIMVGVYGILEILFCQMEKEEDDDDYRSFADFVA